MAEVKGCGGSITYSGLTAGVKAWSLDWKNELLDATDFADACAKSYIAGYTDWTATITANWDAANTAKPGDAASSLVLTVTSGKTYTGNAIITGLAINVNVAGIVEATYSFQGTGTLTPA
jgi:hypothetical protein